MYNFTPSGLLKSFKTWMLSLIAGLTHKLLCKCLAWSSWLNLKYDNPFSLLQMHYQRITSRGYCYTVAQSVLYVPFFLLILTGVPSYLSQWWCLWKILRFLQGMIFFFRASLPALFICERSACEYNPQELIISAHYWCLVIVLSFIPISLSYQYLFTYFFWCWWYY